MIEIESYNFVAALVGTGLFGAVCGFVLGIVMVIK